MIQRQLLQWQKKVRERPQIVHIVGLRQTGKTTLMAEFRLGEVMHPMNKQANSEDALKDLL